MAVLQHKFTIFGATKSAIYPIVRWEFVILVGIASAIALPVAAFLAHLWLSGYAFHISLDAYIFIFPPLILLLIALVTISVQSIKAAVSKPIGSIRSE